MTQESILGVSKTIIKWYICLSRHRGESKRNGVMVCENSVPNLLLYEAHYKSVEVGKDGHCEES